MVLQPMNLLRYRTTYFSSSVVFKQTGSLHRKNSPFTGKLLELLGFSGFYKQKFPWKCDTLPFKPLHWHWGVWISSRCNAQRQILEEWWSEYNPFLFGKVTTFRGKLLATLNDSRWLSSNLNQPNQIPPTVAGLAGITHCLRSISMEVFFWFFCGGIDKKKQPKWKTWL